MSDFVNNLILDQKNKTKKNVTDGSWCLAMFDSGNESDIYICDQHNMFGRFTKHEIFKANRKAGNSYSYQSMRRQTVITKIGNEIRFVKPYRVVATNTY